MKRLAALITVLMLITGMLACAETSSASFGPYTLAPNGSYELIADTDGSYNVFFNTEGMAGSISYLSFENTDLHAMLFEDLGLSSYTEICDYYLDNLYSSNTMFSGMVREYNEYNGVACVSYYGNLTPDSAAELGSDVYSGVALGVGEGLMIILVVPYEKGVTMDTAEGVIDTLLASVSVRGAALLSAGGGIYLNNAAGQSYTVGNSVITPPADWVVTSQSASEIMFSYYDKLIMIGTYSMTADEIAALRSLGDEGLGETLTFSTETGLDGMGLDSSLFGYYTSFLFSASPVVYFSGDASAALGENMYLDGATMLTDTELAMVLVFSDGTDYDTADDLRYRGVEMLLY